MDSTGQTNGGSPGGPPKPPAGLQQPVLTSREKTDLIIEGLKKVSLEETKTIDTAFNNLLVLARDNSPKVVFEHPDCLDIIAENLEKNKSVPENSSVVVSCFRLLSELSKGSERALVILNKLTIDHLTDIICYSTNSEVMTAFQYLVQTIINSLAGVQEMLNKQKEQAKLDRERTLTVAESITTKQTKRVDDAMMKAHESVLLNILIRLIRRSSSFIITAAARDCILALVMSNIDYQGLNYGVQLVEADCLQNLLDVASEVDDLRSSSSMEITSMTHSLVSAVLDKMYSCLDHDKVREMYREKVQEYLNKRLRNPDMDDKIRAAKLFTVLLAGPAEIGNSCVGQAGMIEMLLAMASSDEPAQQRAALDTIIAAACKKDKCTAIATLGEKVLNNLRESKNEEIRLRALVGLSKVSSVGSTDASIRPFSNDANAKFALDCREIIKRPTPEFKLKQYAIEALAFLSFDGDVKEQLVYDEEAISSILETIKRDVNSPVVYSILNIFVNLTNSYDKQEHAPELIELAKFAQQHIPKEHPKDQKQYLDKRLIKLANSDLVPTLLQISQVDSKAAKELLGRIMNALCEMESVRGKLVQQGAVKLLISLTQCDSKTPDISYLLAAQALARLGISINPEFVFPGQRLLAVIKPLKRLLNPNCTALQNFESLLALTNIAQTNENARIHLLHENGFSLIEALMFEEHVLVRRAAVQCTANLIRHPQLVSLYESENDRVKYLVILCEEEDLETVKAASGALAMLCQVSEKACERIFVAKHWDEILMFLLSNENMELVHRAAVIVNCIIRCENKSLAEKVFESKLFEIMSALTLPEMNSVPGAVKEILKSSLKLGKQRNLIKDTNSLKHIKEEESVDDDSE